MKRRKGVLLSACLFLGVAVGTLFAQAKATHPELSEEEQYVACRDCHREVTEDIYQDWYNSVHGIANVRCYQCHGTLEEFYVTPPVFKCASCHSKEVSHMKVPEGLGKATCWTCHPVHRFQVHK